MPGQLRGDLQHARRDVCGENAAPGADALSRHHCRIPLAGPLEEDTISDGCVICRWHGSTFRFADGSIVRGPASTPEPCYQTRIQDGRIEIRAFA